MIVKMEPKATVKDLAAFERAVGNAATYIAIAHGAGLLSVASILPALLKDPKLAALALPAWDFLTWGLILAMLAHYVTLVPPLFRWPDHRENIFTIVAVLGLLGSFAFLLATLRELYDALKAASVLPG